MLTWVLNAWHHQFPCNMTSCVQAEARTYIVTVDKPKKRALQVGLVTCDHDVTFRRSRSGNRLSKPPYSFFLPCPNPHWALRLRCKKYVLFNCAFVVLDTQGGTWPRSTNRLSHFPRFRGFLRSCTCIMKSRKRRCFHKSTPECGCEVVIWLFLRWF